MSTTHGSDDGSSNSQNSTIGQTVPDSTSEMNKIKVLEVVLTPSGGEPPRG